tara:strand:+ start:243 stop:410 length:168 start_codon:yes stop_codon:yes gene_type:complete
MRGGDGMITIILTHDDEILKVLDSKGNEIEYLVEDTYHMECSTAGCPGCELEVTA